MRLHETGEGRLIRTIRERFHDASVTLGIGDDAAIVQIPEKHAVVACSDLLAENTHFLRGVHPAGAIAYKSVAANVSDVGAMGGVPMHFLVSLAVPGDLDWSWMEGFFDGLEEACRKFGVSLIGGDSSSAERIFVDVSMIGRVPAGKSVRRSGAQVGDGIYVTGSLGGSALGLELLRNGDTSGPAVIRHLYPEPRHRVGAAVLDVAHAMIDVSDGLSTDLGHILEESKVSARLYRDRIPAWPGVREEHVFHGGEEYELIIVAPSLPERIEDVTVTRIGEVIASAMDHQVFVVDGVREWVLQARGWQHFSQMKIEK